MKNNFKIIFITFLFIAKDLSGQDFGDFEVLYKDNDITVEVHFKEVNGCSDGKKNSVEYRVKGYLNSFADYIIWQTDYTDCNGHLFFQQHSLDISIANEHSYGSNKARGDVWTCPECEFTAKNIVRKFYGATRSQHRSNNSGPQRPQKSNPAIAIDGPTKAYYNISTTLTVNGGDLGTGANWVWYKNSCGDEKVGEGTSIEVTPLDNTTYYVRAEGLDTTRCVQKTVYITSKEPDYVNGGGDIKLDESATLRIEGGALTPGSSWVWYENACEGNRVGSGNSITVSPQVSTVYYVKAEGKSPTDCKKVEVKILPRDPSSISSSSTFSGSFIGKENIQIGQSTTLSVKGGYLTRGDNWVWYESTCGGKRVSTGSEITITPIESVSYYVRAEGKNSPSNCARIEITPQIPNTYGDREGSPYIDKFDFKYSKGKIRMYYKIKNKKSSDRFNLSIKGFRNSGELTLTSLRGSLDKPNENLTKGRGWKKIIWDAKKDGYQLNEKVVFQLTSYIEERVSLTPRLAKSLIFPGWGDIHLRNKKSRLGLGIAAYSLVAASIIFNSLANQNYSSYVNSTSTQSYDNAVTNNQISIACAGVAVGLWTIDLVGILTRRHKVKKNLSLSEYYYNRSKFHMYHFSEVKMIEMTAGK